MHVLPKSKYRVQAVCRFHRTLSDGILFTAALKHFNIKCLTEEDRWMAMMLIWAHDVTWRQRHLTDEGWTRVMCHRGRLIIFRRRHYVGLVSPSCHNHRPMRAQSTLRSVSRILFLMTTDSDWSGTNLRSWGALVARSKSSPQQPRFDSALLPFAACHSLSLPHLLSTPAVLSKSKSTNKPKEISVLSSLSAESQQQFWL